MIEIKQNYKSSTRIDSVASPNDFIDNIVLHGTALNAIETLSLDFVSSQQRCFTLTGPYGSGKSTLAVFLSFLLSKDNTLRSKALSKFQSSSENKEVFEKFHLRYGWDVVSHVCGLEDPVKALTNDILTYFGIQQDLTKVTDPECLKLIETSLDSFKESDGLVILLDEMGKALDFQARENRDLYFFQQLADIVQKSKSQVMLIGFLHQSFGEYSRSMTAKVQREWSKVQGRYKDINYSPSVDESLVLIANTISKNEEIAESMANIYSPVVKAICDNVAAQRKNSNLLLSALPIDPIVSILLGPLSKRSFSQNERSLFGFLASNENRSFNRFLQEFFSNDKTESGAFQLYTPDMFWGYLEQNLDHVISSSRDSKAWLEAKDAVHRASIKGSELQIRITKVIALFSLFGFNYQLFASKELIKEYFVAQGESPDAVKIAIESLETRSVIIYRVVHDALMIFQGSDLDINELIEKKIDQIKDGRDWTSALNLNHYFLATSHYHRTGTMRWGQSMMVSEKSLSDLDKISREPKGNNAFLYLVIPTSKSLLENLVEKAKSNPHILVGDSERIEGLKSFALELIAINEIEKENEKLVHDNIAKQEINNRTNRLRRQIEAEFDAVFTQAIWAHYPTGDVTANKEYEGEPISSIVSKIADVLYCDTPELLNELVNRNKPSGSANAAIKKLLIAMAEHADEKNLGFPDTTFPAEKGLYISCIKNLGIHHGRNGPWKFELPEDDGVNKLYEVAAEHINSAGRIVWLSEIDDLWAKKPFGLSKGLRTIWLMAFVMSMKEEYAFFDRDDATQQTMFITEPDDEYALKVMQKPKDVGVQSVIIDKEKTAYLEELVAAIDGFEGNHTPLKLAEYLVTFYSKLSPWTKCTSTLETKARQFVIQTAKASDPNQYLFEVLPEVLGKRLSDIRSEDLSTVLGELKFAHRDMLDDFKRRIHRQLPADASLVGKCKSVAEYTSDYKLATFADRVASFASDSRWVSGVIALLSSKSEKNWDDSAIHKARTELSEIIEKFKVAAYHAAFEGIDLNEIAEQHKDKAQAVSNVLSSLRSEEKLALLTSILDTELNEVSRNK